MRFVDLTGQRFGRLTVTRRVSGIGVRRLKWECRCDCGSLASIDRDSLRSGHTRSCGCLKLDKLAGNDRSLVHGFHESRTWRSWRGMLTRCSNPKAINYSNYGGRGIRVCERWRSFELFLADMGERPAGRSLDRIDGNGNYEPANRRWATAVEQRKNQRAPKKKEQRLSRGS